MTDRKSVLKWAHLSRGAGTRTPREREIIEDNRRQAQEHIAEIEAEQVRKNAELPDLTGLPTLQIAPRYRAKIHKAPD